MSVHYKELSDRAFKYHNSGEYDKAKELYLQLLAINPDDPNVLNLLGMLYLSQRDIDNAINYISKSFLLKQNSYVAGNLAKAYFMNNDYNNAVKFFETALSYGESCDLYYSLAYTYKKLGRIDDAIEFYKKAVKINPKHYNSLFNLSIAYSDKNDIDSAIFYVNMCKNISENAEVYELLSEYYQKKGLIDNAIECIKKAIEFNDKKNIYFYNLGALYTKKRNEYLVESFTSLLLFYNLLNIKLIFIIIINILNDLYNYEMNSVNSYKTSIKLNIHHVNSYINLVNILKFQNRTDICITILNVLIKTNPNCTNVYGMLASCYLEVNNYESALKYYDKAIEVSGDDISLLKGKAVALKYSGRYEEAKSIFAKINKLYPQDVTSKVSLGMCLLSEKNFIEGYELYRLRSKDSSFSKKFNRKIWKKGVSLDNKDILLYSDCGFGDSIMYSRYINELSKIAKSITIQTDSELIRLFRENFKSVNIITKGEKPNKYDIVMPFMDIQYALNIDFNAIPYLKKYLYTEKSNIINSDKIKIGLFWKGSNRVINNRSVPYEIISKLTEVKKCDFYSFQIDENKEGITNLNTYINDMYDSAKLLKEIDLLITIDSAIVHLAGALGVKTWLLLPYVSEWRWFNNSDTTPWYDSVRIFKQDKVGDWESLINTVKTELENL